MTRSTLLIALLAVTISACGQTGAGLSDHRLQDIVDSWRESAGVRGAVIGVTSPDGTVVAASGSTRSGGTDERLDPTVRFDTFSISKVFTAADILLLQEEGLLSLNDAATDHVSIIPTEAGITIEDLLTHRSGLVDYRALPEFWAARLADPSDSWPAEKAVSYAIDHGLRSEPGTEYAYADTNYVILARIIEEVSGHSLAAELSERVFGPLGLTATELRGAATSGYVAGELACEDLNALPGSDALSNRDELCVDGTVGYSEAELDPTFDRGASGVISTIPDLARWAEALFDGTAGIDVDAMLPEANDEYGIGLMRTETPIGTAYGHTGGGFGQARWWHVPSSGVTVVAWSTQEGSPNLDQLVDSALRAFAGETSDLDAILGDLDDPVPETRRAAAEALGNMGRTSRSVTGALLGVAGSDPDESVRAAAAFAVGTAAAGSDDADVIDGLAAILLTDSSSKVRRRAALALGLIGPRSAPILQAAIESQPPDVRDAIEVAIARLDADWDL